MPPQALGGPITAHVATLTVDAGRLVGSFVVGSLDEVVPNVALLPGRLLARTSGMHPTRGLGRPIKARIDIGDELFWTAGFVESHGWCFAGSIGSWSQRE